MTFIKTGGTKLTDYVNRNMEKIMTDEAAQGISLKGQKGNDNFSTTNIYSALIG